MTRRTPHIQRLAPLRDVLPTTRPAHDHLTTTRPAHDHPTTTRPAHDHLPASAPSLFFLRILAPLLLTACGEPSLAPTFDPDLPILGPASAATLSPCPGSDEAFAFRALRLIAGRRPEGVRELGVLASQIRRLDAAGHHGRRVVADSLTRDPGYARRWRNFLRDHLRVARLGSTSAPDCDGHPGPAADGPALAAFIRDHGPEEPVPEDMSEWSMADLLASAVALDDVRPLLRAHLLARQARAIGGNNVAPAELERARRVYLGRDFEAAYLGRRLECLPCHNSDASVTDHPDPPLDRSWPVLPGLEARVYGPLAALTEDVAYTGFRVHGFVDGPFAPWGGRACGELDPGRAGDLLAISGELAGPLPIGAHALDLEARLRDGLATLQRDGLDAADTPTAALAGLIALNLADAVWREAAGHPLTLPHGQPRNREQQALLRHLARTLVERQFSLRALVVEVAVHPYLDLDEPTHCHGALPPVLEPFAADNHAGDGLRREDPWISLDAAAHALGWRAPKHFPLPYGWEDETLMRSLGVYLDASEPGHRGIDLVGALAWERSIGAGADPGWAGDPPPHHDPHADVITRLIALARADPTYTVEDLALAIQDRVIQETAWTDHDHRGEIEALLDLPLADRAAAHAPELLEAALRRLAGALLMSPQFTLAGLTPPPWTRPPRLVLPHASTAALCAQFVTQLPAGLADAACDDAEVPGG